MITSTQQLWDPNVEPRESEILAKAILRQYSEEELEELFNNDAPVEFTVDLLSIHPYEHYEGKESISLYPLKYSGEFFYQRHRHGSVFSLIVTYKVILRKEPIYV